MELIYLLVAHHFGDVWAQPSWLIKNKKKHYFAIFEHVMVYTGIISIALHLFGLYEPWKFFYILIGHFIIDAVKYHWLEDDYNLVYPDQLLHYIQILTIYFL